MCLLQIRGNGERSGKCAACWAPRFRAVQGWSRHTEKGFWVYLAKFHWVATSGWRGGGDERQACPFCLVLNALIDKQGFSLSVRMKHRQALQPRAGVVESDGPCTSRRWQNMCVCAVCVRGMAYWCWEWSLEQMDRAVWPCVHPKALASSHCPLFDGRTKTLVYQETNSMMLLL